MVEKEHAVPSVAILGKQVALTSQFCLFHPSVNNDGFHPQTFGNII
jgi:hypothetical protein